MALVAGTDAGWLLFYSLAGDLLHKQSIYPAKILKLNFSERKENAWEDAGSDELSVVFPGVIARCDGADLQIFKVLHPIELYSAIGPMFNLASRFYHFACMLILVICFLQIMLQKSFQEVKSRMWKDKFEQEDGEDTSSFEKIPLQIWNSSQRHYCAITVGEDAVVSAYRLSEDRSRSLVGAILSRGVAATFSTISSLSKILWRSEPSPTKKSRPKPQAFAKTSPLTCLKDSPRKGERLTLSPSGTLAAITDSLGRILLLDTRALVAVRLWKGYRDASCLFVEMLRNKDKASSSSMHLDYTKSDYCLCLAIHAPRKGIIEVWQMRTGQRLLTIPCPKGSRILQPSTRFSSSAFSSYTPLEVYLFNGDSGQLSVLNRHIG
ncbi:hypothetical protein TRIUR3_28411 [Triticum urartu]|uniref:Rab3-GAP regulatory subunit N-terminal domain-containing protein n=1 Tax=Triticum urartu TaxID=4572 RepID=M7Z3D4_TRIUA|nr:hypothetical protein TRIUR3_28411 [Triticum urartu]